MVLYQPWRRGGFLECPEVPGTPTILHPTDGRRCLVAGQNAQWASFWAWFWRQKCLGQMPRHICVMCPPPFFLCGVMVKFDGEHSSAACIMGNPTHQLPRGSGVVGCLLFPLSPKSMFPKLGKKGTEENGSENGWRPLLARVSGYNMVYVRNRNAPHGKLQLPQLIYKRKTRAQEIYDGATLK